MKKPIVIQFNDAHLNPGNEKDVEDSCNHVIEYALSKNIDKIIFAGDFFHSRTAQRQEVLLTLDRILTAFYDAGIWVYFFPGNHDKTMYESKDSFLEIFRHYPGVTFNKEPSRIELGGIKIDLIPFYSNDKLVPMLENAEGGDILISHFEMNGSTNLGHVITDSPINRKMLKKWKKVYLGHFHNWVPITDDIVHLPSLRQNHFGEDSNKGFSVLYDDLSYEIIQGRFRHFNKIVIDLNESKANDVSELIKIHRGSKDTIRFEFTGDTNKLKALDKEQFKGTGIDIKIKYDKIYDTENVVLPVVTEKHDKASVLTHFESFCEDKGYDLKRGKELMIEFLKNKQ